LKDFLTFGGQKYFFLINSKKIIFCDQFLKSKSNIFHKIPPGKKMWQKSLIITAFSRKNKTYKKAVIDFKTYFASKKKIKYCDKKVKKKWKNWKKENEKKKLGVENLVEIGVD